MSNKFERSIGLRFISSVAALALICTVIYVIVAGFDLMSTLILVAASGGLVGQSVFFGESFVECIVGFFEILIESVSSVFEAIASVFNF
jgi:hypothetical protein